jgi:ABC-type nitrate/sulfonate/bicarbonate transport system permease component
MSAEPATGAVRTAVRPPTEAPPTTMAGGPRGRWWERLDRRTTAVLLAAEAALILTVWQVAIGTLELVSPVFLPPPLEILDGFATLASRDDMLQHLATSLWCWSIGFGLAVVVGVVLGVVTGASLPVERLSSPVLWTIYATPWLAYRPLSVVWFGFGLAPIIFLVFVASLFPVLLNTAAGVRSVDPSLLQASRVFGISRLHLYRTILLPSALPFVIVGMRQSAVMATISLIVAEMTGSSVGLGALVGILTSRYQTGQAFALIVIAVLWTVGIGQLLKAIGRRIAPWQTDARLA